MIFEKIGVYGMSNDIEDAFLASLLTGDPALLIGKQGTSKTGLCSAIGYALREHSKRKKKNGQDCKIFTFRIYDSSKINFEDLIGFPNPKGMQEGKMEFIRSKTTAWDADMIVFDEYNRQEPARQNNIFELQRSRRLMGINTGTKWIFNCMNPFGMAGTEELDEALVDRNCFFIKIPSFVHLSESAQTAIVKHSSESDGPGLRHWTNKKFSWDVSDDSSDINESFANAGEYIEKLMILAGEHYKTIEKASGDAYAKFVKRFICLLSSEMENKEWKVELSGRRAGVIYRALIAFRAIDFAKAELDNNHTVRDLKSSFVTVFQMTIPVGISNSSSNDEFAMISIATTIDVFSDFFRDDGNESGRSSVDSIYEVLTTDNFVRKIDLLLHNVKDEVAKSQIWSTVLKCNINSSNVDNPKNQKAIIMMLIAGQLMTIDPDCVPETVQHLISSKYLNSIDAVQNSMVTLTGPLCHYEQRIKEFLATQKYPFISLQAKVLIEKECSKYSFDEELAEYEFENIIEKIKSECNLLLKFIENSKKKSINV